MANTHTIIVTQDLLNLLPELQEVFKVGDLVNLSKVEGEEASTSDADGPGPRPHKPPTE